MTRGYLNETVPLTDEARAPLRGPPGAPLRGPPGALCVGVCATVTPQHCRGLSRRQTGRETLTAMKEKENEGTADCTGLKGLSSHTTLCVYFITYIMYYNIQ